MDSQLDGEDLGDEARGWEVEVTLHGNFVDDSKWREPPGEQGRN